MERQHIFERGKHSTIIEGVEEIAKALGSIGVELSPGFIEVNVGARGKSIKLKILNAETCELVVVTNGRKQTLKAYGKAAAEIWPVLQTLSAKGWRVHAPLDLSRSERQ